MAVVANGLVRSHVGIAGLEDRDRCAVEIVHVGIKYIRRDVVLRHYLFVGVAGSAQLRRTVAEEGRRGIAHVVDAMALDAGGHVRVLVAQQRRAVDAFGVFIEDGAMTLAAGLGDARAWLAGWWSVMRAVAIDAGGGVLVAVGQCLGMGAGHLPSCCGSWQRAHNSDCCMV